MRKIRSCRGFTLIELLVVVGIIGILASIAIPKFRSYQMKAINTKAISDLKNTKTALEAFRTDKHFYPH